MDFDKFKILVKGMKAVYTSPNFLPDADAVKIWYRLLQDIPYEVMNLAIQKYMMQCVYPPTVADLRSYSADVVQGDVKDWGEGWEAVLRAIRHFGTYRVAEAMETFDPLTRRCVERLGFRNICMSENINTDRANFRDLYNQLATREREESKVARSVKEGIGKLMLERSGALQIEERN